MRPWKKLIQELDLNGKPTLCVLNKTDKTDPDTVRGLVDQLDGIPVCALDRGTFGPLLEQLETRLWSEAATC